MSDALEQIQEARPRRFRPYPEYKDSGVEWLGEIPAHWDAPKMWQISRAASGGTPSKDERAYWNGEIPWVSPKDMKRRQIDSSEDRLTERAVAETGIKLVEPPVMLIVVRGMILAHSFPVAISTVPVTINQDMKAVRFASGIDPLFMVSVFEGVGKAVLAAIVEEAAHGTKAVRMDEWRSVRVPLPDADEQRAIAAFLDRETAKIDGLVARKERLIELLQEKRTALITRAVTRGLDPNVPMKDSGVEWLGEIPAHWEYGGLARWWQVVDCKHRTVTFVEDGVPVVSIGQVQGFEVDLASANRTSPSEYRQMVDGRRDPKIGDIIYSRNATIGAAAIVATREPFCLGQDVCLIRSRIQCQRFLTYVLRCPVVIGQLDSLSVGSTFSRINVSTIKKLLVVVPPVAEQRAIAAFLDRETKRIDALVAKVREAIDHLKEFRTALISAAVTGKIDVREEVA